MKNFWKIVGLLFICQLATAQSYKVSGTLIDSEDNTEVISANVVLTSATDSSNFKATLSNVNGKFELQNITNGTYTLKISYLGYKSFIQVVVVDGADKSIGILKLTRNSTLLKDVTITEQATRMVQKGDTTEFNAGAFKTNPDATTEDLVKKMPGITNENGVIKANGEEIKKVTVDGKDFFGDDASVALKNLPSEIVDKVQVFDRMSDQSRFTGFDDGNSQKSINIVTKSGKTNGVFGKIYGGYGYLTDSRYSAGATINWFNGDRRISMLGMVNNINQQNFSMQDLLGVTGTTQRGGQGGGARSGGRPGASSPADYFTVSGQGGNSTTNSAGFNYSDVWGKKKNLKITGSYFINLINNKNNSDLTRQYFNVGDSSTTYAENNTTESTNQNHRVNLRLEYAIDSMNSITFTPKFSWQQNTQQNTIVGTNTIGENSFLSSINSNYSTKNQGYNLGGDLMYQHKFKKMGRTFSFNFIASTNQKEGLTTQKSFSRFAELNDSTSIDQQAVTNSFNNSTSGSITYTEPAGKEGIMQFTYQPSYAWNNSLKETFLYNGSSDNYSILDTTLSSRYDNDYMTQKGGFSYRYRDEKFNFSIGGNMQYALLTGTQYFPFADAKRVSFINLLPSAMFNYKFSETGNLRLYYRTATNPPSIAQLQNVINNSNPLLLSTGNPDLQQNYSHFLMMRIGASNKKTAQSFFVFASANYTANNITNSTFIAIKDTLLNENIILRAGSQLSKPVNMDGNVSSNVFVTYSLPVNKIKSNLNFNLGYNFLRNPSLINNQTNISNTNGINAGFVLSSNMSEKIDFTINYTANYSIIKNTLQKNSDNNYFNHTAGVNFNWLFWKGFVFNTNLKNTVYAGIAQGFNQNILLLNASIGYKFLKDKSLELRISGIDLLNQNTGIARTVTETYIEDSRTEVLKRYFLVTLTYNLRFYKKEKEK